MRVLVVKDSPRLQTSLNVALRKSGYVVDMAGDGEEGLWLATENDYDVVVLDIMLPKRDGLSLLTELLAPTFAGAMNWTLTARLVASGRLVLTLSGLAP